MVGFFGVFFAIWSREYSESIYRCLEKY